MITIEPESLAVASARHVSVDDLSVLVSAFLDNVLQRIVDGGL